MKLALAGALGDGSVAVSRLSIGSFSCGPGGEAVRVDEFYTSQAERREGKTCGMRKSEKQTQAAASKSQERLEVLPPVPHQMHGPHDRGVVRGGAKRPSSGVFTALSSAVERTTAKLFPSSCKYSRREALRVECCAKLSNCQLAN